MNEAEFRQWFEDHCRFFPGVAAWLARVPAPATSEGVLSAWAEILADCSLELAREATRRMASGVLETPLRAERHVYVVRDYCRSQAAQKQAPKRHFAPGGEEAFRCPMCQDQGTVLIVHPEVVEKLRRGEAIRYPYEVAVACSCPAGKAKSWLAPLKMHHLLIPPGKSGKQVLVEEGLLDPAWPKGGRRAPASGEQPAGGGKSLAQALNESPQPEPQDDLEVF